MFKTERMDAILHILQEKKHVTVHYLAEHVYASEVTIRRDLHKMEELGLIVRSYGGVTLRVTENVSVPLVVREQNLSSVKNRIAEEAVRLIKRDSRHFAKRQLTWFRREAGVTWIDLDEYPDQEELLNFMEETIRTKLQL